MATALPVHPRTGLRALGVMPSGRIVWPILGAEDNPANPVQPPAAPADPDTFPTGTPVAEMTPQQQAAYWRDKARKHEDRVKAYGGVTPEKLAELQERASQWEVLAAASQTDQERAVAEAKQAAAAEAAASYVPRLVSAEFRAAAAGRIDSERLAAVLEPLDMSKFLTDAGTVDAAKVTAFVDGIAPQQPARRTGPSPSGLGNRGTDVNAAPKDVAASYLAKKFPSRAKAS